MDGSGLVTEVLVNHTPYETRVAILEGGVLQDFFVERERKRGIVGNIYKGKVQRVLPGMDAAFIDIGLERAGFLHVKNVVRRGDKPPERISDVLREGQSLLVQVLKDPIGSKGAPIVVFGRFVVAGTKGFVALVHQCPFTRLCRGRHDAAQEEKNCEEAFHKSKGITPAAERGGSGRRRHFAFQKGEARSATREKRGGQRLGIAR